MIKQYSFFIVLFYVITHPSLYASAENVEYKFKSMWEGLHLQILPFDLDQNGEDELVIKSNVQQLDVYDRFKDKCYFSFLIKHLGEYGVLPLISGKLDSLSVLLHHYNKDSSNYHLIQRVKSKSSKIIKNYITFSGDDYDESGQYNQSIDLLGSIYNSKKEKLLLFRINSGHDPAPRGLMAIFPETGEIAWKYYIGPQVISPIIEDINGDGLQEIILGSYAPDNGLEYNDTKDDSCYVFVFNCDGKLLWKKTIGSYFTGVWPSLGDMTGDGKKNLVVFSYSLNSEIFEYDRVMLLDIHNGHVLNTYASSKRFISPSSSIVNLCADLTGDNKCEIVISNSDRTVLMLDGELRIIKYSDIYGKNIIIKNCCDLDGDNVPEVICKTADNEMIILNNKLEQIGKYQLHLGSVILFVKKRLGAQILIQSAGLNGFCNYTLLSFVKMGYPEQLYKNTPSYFIWILIIIVLILFYIIFRNFFWEEQIKKILITFLNSIDTFNNALIIRSNGKVIKGGKNWHKLLMAPNKSIQGENYKQLLAGKSQEQFSDVIHTILSNKLDHSSVDVDLDTQYKISSNYIPFLNLYCLILIDLSKKEHARQIQAWAPVAQRLAHSIKNPLTTVKLNTEDLRDLLKNRHKIEDSEVDDSIDIIISQVDLLKKMTDGFMRFVQFEKVKLLPYSLNEQIKELIPQWHPPSRIGIKINYDLHSNLPDVLLDLKQFSTILENIFFNAIDSIKNEGTILISTKIVQIFSESNKYNDQSNFVELQIRDTGIGIKKEYLEKILQPYFTLKKGGTGLGLSITHKIMQDHGGDIFIESDEGIGTTITLRFQIAN